VQVDQNVFEAGITHKAKLTGKYTKNGVQTTYDKDDDFERKATPDPRIQVALSSCEQVTSREFNSDV
jgi:hypothetical protein